MQSVFCSGDIASAKFDERERKVILVVVGVFGDGVLENFGSMRDVAEVGIDIAEKSEESGVFLAVGRNRLRGFEGLGVRDFAEKRVGKVEFYVVGIGIGVESGLEMLNGVVIETIAGEKNADAGLRAVVGRAEFIELGDGFASFVEIAEL